MTYSEKWGISGRQMVFLMIAFIIGTTVILPPGQDARQEAWIAILIGAGESLIVASIFTALSRRFPGKSIVEILGTVFGPYLGKLMGLFFLWYLFHVGSFVIRNVTDFFTVAIMPETPSVVFAALLLLVSSFAVFNGLEVIARCGLVLVPITVISVFAVSLLELNQLDFKNFFPLFQTPLPQLLKISQTVAVFPFGETVLFLMVFPFLKPVTACRSKTLFGILTAAFLIIVASWQSIGVLGASINILSYPLFEALKLIVLPFINMRMEVIVTLNFITMIFLKIAVIHFGVVLGLGQMFKLRSSSFLIIPIGILMIILSEINFSGFIQNIEFNRISPIYVSIFQLGIPLLTLTVALVRKLPRRPEE